MLLRTAARRSPDRSAKFRRSLQSVADLPYDEGTLGTACGGALLMQSLVQQRAARCEFTVGTQRHRSAKKLAT